MKLSYDEKIIAKTITEGIKGAIKWFAAMYLIGMVVLIVGGAALLHWAPVDSSDASATERSGMRIRTDALTGCQYLESSKGFLTPRLDSDNQMVCGEGGEE